ncbi:uncharacterized protein C8Q71DRAFT_420578 [Rhodofomes roseus]|uniref:Uncharacterized protein n=1 Tax=Rhodofomes roseus TaxID=34475 RepID=A0ABQ8KQ15_9APHY|nr:uncharacterized protein C8Q71DRAFT_420578 [Rhodofomes roseus]KAH9840706.1 hypothetical protein C8Q71DRAFT_420578 [Rhodofomes roseus]
MDGDPLMAWKGGLFRTPVYPVARHPSFNNAPVAEHALGGPRGGPDHSNYDVWPTTTLWALQPPQGGNASHAWVGRNPPPKRGATPVRQESNVMPRHPARTMPVGSKQSMNAGRSAIDRRIPAQWQHTAVPHTSSLTPTPIQNTDGDPSSCHGSRQTELAAVRVAPAQDRGADFNPHEPVGRDFARLRSVSPSAFVTQQSDDEDDAWSDSSADSSCDVPLALLSAHTQADASLPAPQVYEQLRDDNTTRRDASPSPRAASSSTSSPAIERSPAPSLPANAKKILAYCPWSLREAYLLVFIITQLSPGQNDWESISDLYNYMLMGPDLHIWMLNTAYDLRVHGERQDEFWAQFWMLMWENKTRWDDSGRHRSERAKTFLQSVIDKAYRQTRPPERGDVSGVTSMQLLSSELAGMAHLFSEDRWYNVDFDESSPLRYDPSLAGALLTLTWAGVPSTHVGQSAALRPAAVEAFACLYGLLPTGPRYPLRAPWECWYRWNVRLWKTVSKNEDYTIDRSADGVIIIRRAGTTDTNLNVNPELAKAARNLASTAYSGVATATAGADAQTRRAPDENASVQRKVRFADVKNTPQRSSEQQTGAKVKTLDGTSQSSASKSCMKSRALCPTDIRTTTGKQ